MEPSEQILYSLIGAFMGTILALGVIVAGVQYKLNKVVKDEVKSEGSTDRSEGV